MEIMIAVYILEARSFTILYVYSLHLLSMVS